MSDFDGLRGHNPIDPRSFNQGIAPVSYSDPNNLIVVFYTKAVHNPFKSQEEGKPVFENKDYIKIEHPGEANLTRIDRPVRDSDKRQYAHQWNAYINNKPQISDGIPLDLLFPHQPNIPMNLRHYNIHTVEQLAELSGHALNTVGLGATEWQVKAKKYIAQAEKGVNHHKFDKEVNDLKQQNSLLAQQVETLKARLDEVLMASGAIPPRPMPASIPMPPIPTHVNSPNFDAQTAMINNVAAEKNLSPAKKGGRPKGSKNKPKMEN